MGTREYPFITLEQARDTIRENRKKTPNKENSYRIVLMPGNYFLKDSFTLTENDSGATNVPIIYEAEQKGSVILNGGIIIPIGNCKKLTRNIKGYTTISDEARNKVYYVELDKILPKKILRQDSIDMNGSNSSIAPVELCINGEIMTLARYPNTGFATTGISPDSLTIKFNNDRINNWGNEPNARILGYLKYGWSFSLNRISSINVNEKTITLLKSPVYGLGINRPFFMSNLLSELDTAKEYYIDYQSSILYFIPPTGIEMSKSIIELSNLGDNNKSMVEIDRASNITFRNITFTLSRYGAINIKYCKSITLSDLIIHNIGNFGVNATGIDNHFLNLELSDLGGIGFNIIGGDRRSLTSSHNLIENCQIRRISRIQRTYNPAISISGVGNVISNCQISDLPHIAILFQGNENRIDNNEIYDVCNETSDAGAIYTGRDWGSQGNVIQNNFIHDIITTNTLDGGKVHAIYLDDCASGITVKSNILRNIESIGVLIGGGRDNNVSGNIIVACGISAIHVDARGLKCINQKNNDSWNLKEKIETLNYKSDVWSKKYPKLASIFDNGDEESKLPYGTELKYNVLWNNKTSFYEGSPGTFKFISISNNGVLKLSPFSTDNVTSVASFLE